jgi:energy-coupling factor transport system substrate-specific component
MTKHVSAQKIALIALFIVINIVGGHLALYARLPIYLDTIGDLAGECLFWTHWWSIYWHSNGVN